MVTVVLMMRGVEELNLLNKVFSLIMAACSVIPLLL